jgi:hypothetical protein
VILSTAQFASPLLEHCLQDAGADNTSVTSIKHHNLLLALRSWFPTICFPAPKRFLADIQFQRKLFPRFPQFQPVLPDLLTHGYQRIKPSTLPPAKKQSAEKRDR